MVFDKPKRRAHRESMSAPSWFRELPPRLRSHWRLKSLWIPVFMTAFFCAYFLVLRHPLRRRARHNVPHQGVKVCLEPCQGRLLG